MPLGEARISIVGLGLMGGSLSAALAGSCAALKGYDQDPATRARALETGWFDSIAVNLSEAIQDADLLILAVPVRSILEILERIGHDLPAPRSVMDLGSTKVRIAEAMEKLPEYVDALPAHPMCGREVSGIASADPQLYNGCRFVLCPLERTSPRTLNLAHEITTRLQAIPLEIAPGLHDSLTALTSHLPYLLASALVHTASQQGAGKPVWDLAASGFRDTSRVAAGSLPMMIDILLTNKAPVLEALEGSRAFLEQLADAVENQDALLLEALLDPPRQIRSGLFIHNQEGDTP